MAIDEGSIGQDIGALATLGYLVVIYIRLLGNRTDQVGIPKKIGIGEPAVHTRQPDSRWIRRITRHRSRINAGGVIRVLVGAGIVMNQAPIHTHLERMSSFVPAQVIDDVVHGNVESRTPRL